MIIAISLHAGTANRLFQLASCYGMIKKLQEMGKECELKITFAWCAHPIDNQFFISKFPTLSETPTKTIKEDCFSYDECLFQSLLSYSSNPNSNKEVIYIVDSYLQSELYFLNYEKEIRELLGIIPNKRERTIALHARRGDYVGSQLHDTHLFPSYFEEASKQIDSSLYDTVILFSDDSSWICNNLHSFQKMFPGKKLIIDHTASPIECIKEMASCYVGAITSNSSFSWWGAWLNTNSNKIIVQPKKWFGREMRGVEYVYIKGALII